MMILQMQYIPNISFTFSARLFFVFPIVCVCELCVSAAAAGRLKSFVDGIARTLAQNDVV